MASASNRGGRPSVAAIYRELVMANIPYRTALIVGAGPGISASVARGLASVGLKVGLAARNVEKLVPLATEIRAQTCSFRYGQICVAWSSAERRARARAQGHPHRPLRNRRRSEERGAAGSRGPPGQHTRSRGDRPYLSRSLAPAAQRL